MSTICRGVAAKREHAMGAVRRVVFLPSIVSVDSGRANPAAAKLLPVVLRAFTRSLRAAVAAARAAGQSDDAETDNLLVNLTAVFDAGAPPPPSVARTAFAELRSKSIRTGGAGFNPPADAPCATVAGHDAAASLTAVPF